MLTPSRMLALGTEAPFFELPDTDGKKIRLDQFPKARAYLVCFICNHCPYVQHIRKALALLTSEYLKKGIAVVGINSNDVKNYPDDSPEQMKIEKKTVGYEFPYLFDESQEIAKAFEAACTPDFYLFDEHRKLVYRGQFDSSRPGNRLPVTGEDLRAAMDAVLTNQKPNPEQKPSVGCNIKWKPPHI